MVVNIVSFARRQIARRGAPMWAPNPRAATWGRPYIVFLALVILAFSLAACGKKGPPEPPEGKTDQFPRQYPDPSSL